MQTNHYDEAIIEYRAAYALAPSPAFLYNIAQAYRRNGNSAAALEYYRMYLDKAPNGEAAGAAREHIAGLATASLPPSGIDQSLTSAQEPATSAIVAPHDEGSLQPSPLNDPPPAPTGMASPPTVVAQSSGAVHAPELSPSNATTTTSASTLRTVGLATSGVGVIAVAAGVYFGLRANRLSDRVSRVYDLDDDRDGQAANRNMIASYSIGGACIVASAVLYYLGRRSRSPVISALAVRPNALTLAWTY